jgi:predicted nucleic acid-binding protein
MFEGFLESVPVFTFDDNVILLAADIYADLRKNGKTVGDDKFEKACSKLNLNTKVMNPLNFLLEVMGNERDD